MPANIIFSGVYQIRNTANDRVYIGSAKNVYKRICLHQSYLNNGKHKNKHMQYSWKKHGTMMFEFSVIEAVEPHLLIETEQRWIDAASKKYNLRLVAHSNLGTKRTEEAIQKTRNALIGRKLSLETREKLRLSKLGKKASLETKAKMSATRKGRGLKSEHKLKIALTKMGELNPSAKLSNKDVALIKRLLFEGIPQVKIADMFNVSRTIVCEINTGRKWASVKMKEVEEIASKCLQKC